MSRRLPDSLRQFVAEILPKSRIGEATIKTLHLNDPERLIHRRLLMEDGLYP